MRTTSLVLTAADEPAKLAAALEAAVAQTHSRK